MDQEATPDVVSALVKSRYCLLRSVHPHAASDSFSLRDVVSIWIHRASGQEMRASAFYVLMFFCNAHRRAGSTTARGAAVPLFSALIGLGFKSSPRSYFHVDVNPVPWRPLRTNESWYR